MTTPTNPYERAARALYLELAALFSDEGMALMPEPPTSQPRVSYGTPVNRPPHVVWVDPLPTSNTTSGSASNSENRRQFDVTAYVMCAHSDRNVAVGNVCRDLWAMELAVASDCTVHGAVDTATPRVSETAVDSTTDKRWIAAASLEVTVQLYSVCPRDFRAAYLGLVDDQWESLEEAMLGA